MKKILMVGYIELEQDPRVLREAKALIEYGNIVDVITLKTETNKNIHEFEGIRLYKVNMYRKMSQYSSNYLVQYTKFFFIVFFKILYLSIKNKYDIYYFHNIPDFLVFDAFFQKLLLKKRIILDIHDPMSFSLKSRFGFNEPSLKFKLIQILEKLSWHFSDKLVTVNKRCKILIENELLNKKKVDVILNLPDSNVFEEANKKIPEFKDRFVLLYTGTLTYWYGLHLAINAISSLKDNIPNILLCIIGKGPELENLKKLTEKRSLSNYVLFKDSLPQKDLVPYIYCCSLGISPHLGIDFSKIYFSTKVVEYLYCNKMIICSRTQGILDYFDEDDLFFFTPGSIEDFVNKILLSYNNKELVNLKIQKIADKLKLYNWELEKQKLNRLIERGTLL